MKTPDCGNSITKCWVQFVLQQHEAKKNSQCNIEVTDFTVVMATKPGESFNAELVKVDAVAKVFAAEKEGEASQGETKEFSFIAKFLSQDPFNRELVKKFGYHIREYTMYSETVHELNKYGESHSENKEIEFRLNVPELYHGVCEPGEYVLAMENCKSSGYETNDKHKGLDYKHTLIAVNHVARLHALSYSYNKSVGGKFLEKRNCFQVAELFSQFFKPMAMVALDSAINFLKTLPDYKEIVSKLELGKLKIPSKFANLFDDQTQHKLLCLTHGDFWNSNLMYKYKDASKDGDHEIEDIKLIDWQISSWGNPVFDLHYLINTSTTASVRDSHLDEILRHYHNTFMTIASNLGTPVPDWSYDHFNAEFGRTSLVGFFMGVCLIQGTLSNAGKKLNPSGNSNLNNNRNRPVKTLVGKVKTAAAKVIVPMVFRPQSQLMSKGFRLLMRKIFEPISQELIEGKNTVMNDRLLDLIKEADRKGILDVLCI